MLSFVYADCPYCGKCCALYVDWEAGNALEGKSDYCKHLMHAGGSFLFRFVWRLRVGVRGLRLRRGVRVIPADAALAFCWLSPALDGQDEATSRLMELSSDCPETGPLITAGLRPTPDPDGLHSLDGPDGQFVFVESLAAFSAAGNAMPAV
jgi:hypothetical protein